MRLAESLRHAAAHLERELAMAHIDERMRRIAQRVSIAAAVIAAAVALAS